jgi:hypothetical protein
MRKMEPPGRSRPRENWSNVHIVPALSFVMPGWPRVLVIQKHSPLPRRTWEQMGPARDRPPVATAVIFFSSFAAGEASVKILGAFLLQGDMTRAGDKAGWTGRQVGGGPLS